MVTANGPKRAFNTLIVARFNYFFSNYLWVQTEGVFTFIHNIFICSLLLFRKKLPKMNERKINDINDVRHSNERVQILASLASATSIEFAVLFQYTTNVNLITRFQSFRHHSFIKFKSLCEICVTAKSATVAFNRQAEN